MEESGIDVKAVHQEACHNTLKECNDMSHSFLPESCIFFKHLFVDFFKPGITCGVQYQNPVFRICR